MANPTAEKQQVDKGRVIYDVLSKDPKYNKFINPEYEDFSTKLEDPKNAQAVYDVLAKDKKYQPYIGEPEDWVNIFKPEQVPAQEPAIQPGPGLTPAIEEPPTVKEPAAQDPIDFDTFQVDQEPALGPVEEIQQRLEKEMGIQQQQLADDITEDIQAEFDAGNLTEQEANTRLSNRFEEAEEKLFTETDKRFQEEIHQLGFDMAREQVEKETTQQAPVSVSRISNRALSEKELQLNKEAVKKNDDRRKLFNKIATEELAKIPELPAQPVFVSPFGIGAQQTKEKMTPEQRVQQYSKKLFKRLKGMSGEQASGFIAGVGDQGEKMIPFLGALSEIPQLMKQRDVLNKPEDKRTKSEQQLVEAVALMNSFERSGLKPTTYEWGEMVALMVPFLGEFAATAGVATTTARAVGKGLIKKGIGKGLLNYTARGITGAVAQATANPQRYVAETIKRQSPIDVAILNLKDEEVEEITRERKGEPAGEAAAKGYLINVSEMLTERFGFAYGAGAKRFMASKVGKLLVNPATLKKYTLSQIAKRQGLNSLKELKTLKNRIGFNGLVTEIWGEELPNMALNEVITGDSGRTMLESLNPLSKDLLKMVVPMAILQGSIYAPTGVKVLAQTTANLPPLIPAPKFSKFQKIPVDINERWQAELNEKVPLIKNATKHKGEIDEEGIDLGAEVLADPAQVWKRHIEFIKDDLNEENLTEKEKTSLEDRLKRNQDQLKTFNEINARYEQELEDLRIPKVIPQKPSKIIPVPTKVTETKPTKTKITKKEPVKTKTVQTKPVVTKPTKPKKLGQKAAAVLRKRKLEAEVDKATKAIEGITKRSKVKRLTTDLRKQKEILKKDPKNKKAKIEAGYLADLLAEEQGETFKQIEIQTAKRNAAIKKLDAIKKAETKPPTKKVKTKAVVTKKKLPAPKVFKDPAAIKNQLSTIISNQNKIGEILLTAKEKGQLTQKGKPRQNAPENVKKIYEQQQENRADIKRLRESLEASKVKVKAPAEAPLTQLDELKNVNTEISSLESILNIPANKKLRQGLGKRADIDRVRNLVGRVGDLKRRRKALSDQVGQTKKIEGDITKVDPKGKLTKIGKPKSYTGTTTTEYSFDALGVKGKVSQISIEGEQDLFYASTEDGKLFTNGDNSIGEAVRSLSRLVPKKIQVSEKGQVVVVGEEITKSQADLFKVLAEETEMTFLKVFPKQTDQLGRKIKIGLPTGEIVTLTVTPNGKIDTDSKILKEHYPDLVKSLKRPAVIKKLQEVTHESTTKTFQTTNKGNQQGDQTGNSGSTAERKSTKDNLDGYNLLPSGHPIQAVGIDGLQGPNFNKISKMLAILQAGKKIFGKIIFTRNPSKRRRGSLGNYIPSTGRIAVKNIKDVEVIIHEVGHALDDRFDLLGDLLVPKNDQQSKAASELLILSEWGSSPPSNLDQEAAHEYQMGEGVAEFFKSMILNPTETRAKFPNASAYIWDTRFPKHLLKHFTDFSIEIRKWVGSNAKNKIESNIREIESLSRFKVWKDKWFNVPDFYLTNADNWLAEAAEAFNTYKPIKGVFKLLSPITARGLNLTAGFRRSFSRQFLDKAFAFDKTVEYVAREKGQPLLHENNPSILARLLFGLHEKFDDLFETGLVDSKNRRIYDNGESMNMNYLIAPFDKTYSKSIKRGMMDSAEIMIAERIVERFKLRVKAAIAPFVELRSKIMSLRNSVILASVIETEKGFEIKHGVTVPKYKKLFKAKGTQEELQEILNKALAEINEEADLIVEQLRKKLKQAQKIFGDKIIAGIGAGIFRDLDVAVQHIADHRALKVTNPGVFESINEGARRYRNYADKLLRYMVDKGRISEDQYTAIKANNEYYVAMQRVQEIGVDKEIKVYKSTGTGKIGQNTNPIKPFRGSGKEIINPYASLIENTYSMVKEADRNDVMRAFVEPLSTNRAIRQGKIQDFTEIAYEVGESGTGVISVFIKGEQKFFRVHEDIFRYLDGLGQAAYRLPALLTFMPALLRKTVTLSPPFAIKNRLRDFQSRLMLSRFSSLSEKPTEFMPVKEKKEIRSMLSLYGGGQAGLLRDPLSYTRYENVYYGLMDEAIRKASKAGFKIMDAHTWPKFFANYKRQLDKGERATRIQEFKRVFANAKKEGLDDYNAGLIAAFETRDLLDFAVSGEVMSVINQLLPFTNAAIQGLRRAARSIEENPDGFARRIMMYSVVPAVGLRLLIKYGMDDETEKEYLQIPDWQRDMFYNFKIGDQWFALPKPFELGIGASLAERLTTMAIYSGTNESEEADRAMVGFREQAKKAFFPFDETDVSGLGGFGSLTEAQANWAFFRQKHVISPYENGLVLGLRNTESASAVGKLASKVLDALPGVDEADPRKIDHVIRSTTSYFGSAISKITTKGGDLSLYPEDLSIGTIGSIAKALSGLAKPDPVFAAKDVQWVLKTGHAFNITGQYMDAMHGMLALYYNERDKKLKKSYIPIIYQLAHIGRNAIVDGKIREGKLLMAHFKKISKNIEPDTPMDNLFKKYINK